MGLLIQWHYRKVFLETLINTAFGILTGALAVIAYNYYTNKIDKLTYSLDEVGFSIVQTFAATHK